MAVHIKDIETLEDLDELVDAISDSEYVEETIVPKSLEELYVMNGKRFPFFAVKVVSSDEHLPNVDELPIGSVVKVLGPGLSIHNYPVMLCRQNAWTVSVVSCIKVWLFGDDIK